MSFIQSEDLAAYIDPIQFDTFQVPLFHQDAAKELIFKIKSDQLLSLAQEIPILPLLSILEGYPQREQLLKLIILERIDYLEHYFGINVMANQNDSSLQGDLDRLEVEGKEIYALIYSFRHIYFLNKLIRSPHNGLERITDRKLNIGRHKVSIYLTNENPGLNAEQKELLAELFPKEKLKNRNFRRKAHELISLTLLEVQRLILSLLNAILKHDFKLPERVLPYTLTENDIDTIYRYQHHLDLTVPSEQLILLLKRTTYLASNRYDNTNQLMRVIQRDMTDHACQLISSGLFNLNDQDIYQYTALHYAIIAENETIFTHLMARNPELELEIEGGYTALYLACELGNIHFVKCLLAQGANQFRSNNRYDSKPIHIAVKNNHPEVVARLIAQNSGCLSLTNKKGHTPLYLAEDKLVIKKLIETKLAELKPPSQTIVMRQLPDDDQLAYDSSIQDLRVQSLSILNPQANLAILKKRKIDLKQGFFALNYRPIDDKSLPLEQSFFQQMEAAQQEEQKLLKALDFLRRTLATLKAAPNLTKATRYYQVTQIIGMGERLNLSSYVIAIELANYDFYDELILLREGKTALQLAIENNDIALAKTIVTEQPDRSRFKIIYENIPILELRYAAILGKLELVKQLLLLATGNPNINYGCLPNEILSIATSKQEILSTNNEAYIEAEQYLGFNIQTESKINVAELLDRIYRTAQKNTLLVHHLFTLGEYRLFQTLIGEKENTLKKPFLASVVRKIMLINRLRNQLTYLTSLSFMTEEQQYELQLIEAALLKIRAGISNQEGLYHSLKERRTFYAIPPLYVTNMLKHATYNAQGIEATKYLLPVYTAQKEAKIKHIATPKGSQKNIFFSTNSPLTYITPFRKNAPAVIQVKILEALKNKLLQSNQIYTSPHLPAFDIERVEQPIIFIGNNPECKTIYRVCHAFKNSIATKVYQYDYIHAGNLIGSIVIERQMKNEFFEGDNVKIMAYRLIDELRNLKHHFPIGSYYDYILENFNNLHIVDSAKAALFNVLNIEAKITDRLSIEDPAIEIIKNDPPSEHILPEYPAILDNFIKQNKLEEIKEFITQTKLGRDHLSGRLLTAINEQRSEIVQYFLDFGVIPYSRGHEFIKAALKQLEVAFEERNDITRFNTAIDITKLLLEYGGSDSNDPLHIRHAATLENLAGTEQTRWTKNKNGDLLEIVNFLVTNNHPDIHKLVIDNLSHYLKNIHFFTFELALTETHQITTDRLNKFVNYNYKPKISAWLDLLHQEDEIKLQEVIQNAKNIDCTLHLYTHAIRFGKVKIAKFLDNLFKNSGLYKRFPGIFFSIIFNQVDIFKALANNETLRQQLAGKSVIDFAIHYRSTEIIKEILTMIPFDVDIFEKLVNAKMTNAASFFLERMDCNNLKTRRYQKSSKKYTPKTLEKTLNIPEIKGTPLGNLAVSLTLKDAPTPSQKKLIENTDIGHLTHYLQQAIIARKHEIAQLVYFKYKKELLEKNRLCLIDIILCSLRSATRNNNTYLFNFLFTEIINDRNLLTSFVQYKDALFFHNIFSSNNHSFTEISLELINKSDFKDLFFKCSTDKFNLLHYALIAGNTKIIETAMKLLPHLRPSIKQLGFGLTFLVVSYNNINALPFLLQENCFAELSDLEKTMLFITLFFRCVNNYNSRAYDHLSTLKWLFDHEIFTRDFTYQNKNYLQLAFTYYPGTIIFYNNHKTIIEMSKYLCDEVAIELDHCDSEGKTILQYEYKGTENRLPTDILEITYLYLLEHPRVKLPTLSNQGELFLFSIINRLTPTLITKYIQQGGDITVRNSSGCTLADTYLMVNDNGNSETLRELAKYKVFPNHFLKTKNYYCVVSSVNNGKIQILATSNNAIIFNLNDIASTKPRSLFKPGKTSQENGDICSHLHLTNKNTRPSDYVSKIKKSKWIEIAPELTDLDADQFKGLSDLEKLLIVKICKEYNSNPSHYQFCIDITDEKINAALADFEKKIDDIYNYIFSTEQSISGNDQQSIREALMHSLVDIEKLPTYNVQRLLSTYKYELRCFASPFSALIATQKTETLAYLLTCKVPYPTFLDTKWSPAFVAIEELNMVALNLFIKLKLAEVKPHELFTLSVNRFLPLDYYKILFEEMISRKQKPTKTLQHNLDIFERHLNNRFDTFEAPSNVETKHEIEKLMLKLRGDTSKKRALTNEKQQTVTQSDAKKMKIMTPVRNQVPSINSALVFFPPKRKQSSAPHPTPPIPAKIFKMGGQTFSANRDASANRNAPDKPDTQAKPN
jgi:ankyrin repeat protein